MNEPFRISIKAARVNAGFSLDEASKRLDINKRTLINYENGTTVPAWDTLDKISKCYNVSIDNLRLSNSSV